MFADTQGSSTRVPVMFHFVSTTQHNFSISDLAKWILSVCLKHSFSTTVLFGIPSLQRAQNVFG